MFIALDILITEKIQANIDKLNVPKLREKWN